jgi:hypothetical protein
MKSRRQRKQDYAINDLTNGTDFVRIYKDILKCFEKNNPKKTDFNDTSFSELALASINYSFFSTTGA